MSCFHNTGIGGPYTWREYRRSTPANYVDGVPDDSTVYQYLQTEDGPYDITVYRSDSDGLYLLAEQFEPGVEGDSERRLEQLSDELHRDIDTYEQYVHAVCRRIDDYIDGADIEP